MNRSALKAVCGTVLVVIAMYGLAQHIEYSGWILFIALVVIVV